MKSEKQITPVDAKSCYALIYRFLNENKLTVALSGFKKETSFVPKPSVKKGPLDPSLEEVFAFYADHFGITLKKATKKIKKQKSKSEKETVAKNDDKDSVVSKKQVNKETTEGEKKSSAENDEKTMEKTEENKQTSTEETATDKKKKNKKKKGKKAKDAVISATKNEDEPKKEVSTPKTTKKDEETPKTSKKVGQVENADVKKEGTQAETKTTPVDKKKRKQDCEESESQSPSKKKSKDDAVEQTTTTPPKKKHNSPFRVIDPNEITISHQELTDNSYFSKKGDDWGGKANEVLSKVKGKDFRREKTKKKRGSYRGGSIDLKVNSFKFPDDDE